MSNKKRNSAGRPAGSKNKKTSKPAKGAVRKGRGRSVEVTLNNERPVAVPAVEPKRKPGRPPGAKNKNTVAKPKSSVESNEPKRKPGRPPGAKNKANQSDQSRGVGRPSGTKKRGQGRPAGSKNNTSRGKGRNVKTLSNEPSNPTSRAHELYDKKRGPGRPAGSQNRRSNPDGIQIMGDVLIVNLDELNINSIYYKSSNGRSLKCLPLE